jgi:hypothetical protein
LDARSTSMEVFIYWELIGYKKNKKVFIKNKKVFMKVFICSTNIIMTCLKIIVKAFDNCCVIKLHYFLCGSSTEGTCSADPRLLIISRRGRIRVLRLPPPAAAALDRLLHLRAGLTPGVQRPTSSCSCPFSALRPCRQHHVLWVSTESPTSCIQTSACSAIVNVRRYGGECYPVQLSKLLP